MTNKFIQVTRKKKRTDEQTYRREFKPSPVFPFANTSEIVAGAEEIVDFESRNRRAGKYLPFNSARIVNNSSVDITIAINQKRDNVILVPAGTIQPIDNTIAPAISSLIIKNLDGTTSITAGQVNLILAKDSVTTDLVLKRVHEMLLDRS